MASIERPESALGDLASQGGSSSDWETILPLAPSSLGNPKGLGIEKTKRPYLSQSHERDWAMHVLSSDAEIREDIRGWLEKKYPASSSYGIDVREMEEAEGKKEERHQEDQQGSASAAVEGGGKQKHAEQQASQDDSERCKAQPRAATARHGSNANAKNKDDNKPTAPSNMTQLAARGTSLCQSFIYDVAPLTIVFILSVFLGYKIGVNKQCPEDSSAYKCLGSWRVKRSMVESMKKQIEYQEDEMMEQNET